MSSCGIAELKIRNQRAWFKDLSTRKVKPETSVSSKRIDSKPTQRLLEIERRPDLRNGVCHIFPATVPLTIHIST